MRRLILDTNFIIDMARFRIGFEELREVAGPCEICTLDLVLKELSGMASRKTKSGMTARVALEIVKMNNLCMIASRGKDVDSALLDLAGEGVVFATNDSELRKNLKRRKSNVIYLRSKKSLEFE
jgi:rRNA-processing protein FCF1